MRLIFNIFSPLFCLIFWSSSAFAEADYTLTISTISVKETKQNGERWDFSNGNPDIHIVLSVDHHIVLEHSFIKDHSYVTEQVTSASFHMSEHAPSRVHVDFLDRDLKHDDMIDSLDFDINTAQLNEVIEVQSDMVLSFKVKLGFTRTGEAIHSQKESQKSLLICQNESKNQQTLIKKLEADLREALRAKKEAEESSQRTLQAKLSAEESVRALKKELDERDSSFKHLMKVLSVCERERESCLQDLKAKTQAKTQP